MQEWPSDDKPADFEELVNPFIETIKFAYDLNRKNSDKDVPYRGFNHNMNHVCLPIDEKLTVKNIHYELEEQNRRILDVILSAAIQVGIEQGRRITMNSDAVRLLKIQAKIGQGLLQS